MMRILLLIVSSVLFFAVTAGNANAFVPLEDGKQGEEVWIIKDGKKIFHVQSDREHAKKQDSDIDELVDLFMELIRSYREQKSHDKSDFKVIELHESFSETIPAQVKKQRWVKSVQTKPREGQIEVIVELQSETDGTYEKRIKLKSALKNKTCPTCGHSSVRFESAAVPSKSVEMRYANKQAPERVIRKTFKLEDSPSEGSRTTEKRYGLKKVAPSGKAQLRRWPKLDTEKATAVQKKYAEALRRIQSSDQDQAARAKALRALRDLWQKINKNEDGTIRPLFRSIELQNKKEDGVTKPLFRSIKLPQEPVRLKVLQKAKNDVNSDIAAIKRDLQRLRKMLEALEAKLSNRK